MRKVMKFLLAFTFVATIQAYHLGYYQPYVVYPQFYQTFPNIRIPRPFMEHEIESHQRNVCKNNIGEVVPCYKSFAEKVDQSRIKPVMSKRPVNPLFYSISQDDEENFLVEFCQALEELDFQTLEQREQSFREFADRWDDMKLWYGYALFGNSEEDIIFRKLTGIDEFFDKDFNAENLDSIVADLKDICANPSAEDFVANFLNISAKFGDFLVPTLELYNEKVQNYIETVCGWEYQYENTPKLIEIGRIGIDSIYFIPEMVDVIQDIQENSKDWKCANRVTKYLNGLIGIMIKTNEYFPDDCPTKN